MVYSSIMACTSPLYAWNTGRLTEKGKPLYFVSRFPGAPSIAEVNKRLDLDLKVSDPFVKDAHLKELVRVPCGTCEACKLDRSRQWAERCMIEASQWQENYFVTLTFDERFVPPKVSSRDITTFMKRLRSLLGPGIRFFGCGEYGRRTHRPHYHLILFNCPISDKLVIGSAGADPLFVSPTISAAWPYGNHMIGNVTAESAAYVARYCNKKDRDDSFIQMSRRPGIGVDWFKDHKEDILPTWKVYFDFGPAKKTAVPLRIFKKVLDDQGVDFSEKTKMAQKQANISIYNDAVRNHDPDIDSYFDRKRSDQKKKAMRLEKKRGDL